MTPVHFSVSKHRVYVILAPPKTPMNDVWYPVLDYSCRWAEGETNLDAAAREITEGIYNSGRFEYLHDNRELYIQGEGAGDVFRLTEFLKRLSGKKGGGKSVRCRDCAWAVVAFSNALGADLGVQYLGNKIYGYDAAGIPTNEISYIGEGKWEEDAWGFHAAAWNGVPGSNSGRVYDACLAIDGDNNPKEFPPGKPHRPVLAANYTFYTAESPPKYNDYKERLMPLDAYEKLKPIKDLIQDVGWKRRAGHGYYAQKITCK